MKTPHNRAFVNQMVVCSLVAIGAGGSFGIGSVWLRHQISVTANADKAIEGRLLQIERQTEQTSTWIAEEQDITALLKRNAEWHLGLVPPQDNQVVRIGEDPVAHLASKRDRGIFEDRGAYGAGTGRVSFRVAMRR